MTQEKKKTAQMYQDRVKTEFVFLKICSVDRSQFTRYRIIFVFQNPHKTLTCYPRKLKQLKCIKIESNLNSEFSKAEAAIDHSSQDIVSSWFSRILLKTLTCSSRILKQDSMERKTKSSSQL